MFPFRLCRDIVKGDGAKMPSGAVVGSQAKQTVSLRTRAARIRTLARDVGDTDAAIELNLWAAELEDRAKEIEASLAP
jgi:hypothetical protein